MCNSIVVGKLASDSDAQLHPICGSNGNEVLLNASGSAAQLQPHSKSHTRELIELKVELLQSLDSHSQSMLLAATPNGQVNAAVPDESQSDALQLMDEFLVAENYAGSNDFAGDIRPDAADVLQLANEIDCGVEERSRILGALKFLKDYARNRNPSTPMEVPRVSPLSLAELDDWQFVDKYSHYMDTIGAFVVSK